MIYVDEQRDDVEDVEIYTDSPEGREALDNAARREYDRD